MTNWQLYNDTKSYRFDTDKAINLLNESLDGFKEKWKKYIDETYDDYAKERLDYADIAEISRNICDRISTRQTNDFDKFFDNLELILDNCNSDLENLMIVGLMEGIQNIGGGQKINYWTGFDKWLGPTTKKHWDNLIYSWEGTDAIDRYKDLNPDNNDLIND